MIRPGATLGILGGGQLGRMLAIAAALYGLKTHIYAPEPDSPAFEVACRQSCEAYEDEDALLRFAAAADVVTYEIENVPRRTAEVIAARTPLFPNSQALSTTQDRLAEKNFVAGLGLPTAPFFPVASEADLAAALREIGRPSVLKTRRFGYDGKGQAMLRPDSDAPKAFADLGRAPCILEGFVPFEREISVVAARDQAGGFAPYEPCANRHRNHILDVTTVPAGLAPATEQAAIEAARRIAEALDYVGVLTVEMFLLREGGGERLVVNEVAPRVHNSGHWTIEGAVTSQFEQHVRAVCGWPLGSPARRGAIEMRNLIGDEVDNWGEVLRDPQAHLHLYGKAEAYAGRKMGHVTWVRPEPGGQNRE